MFVSILAALLLSPAPQIETAEPIDPATYKVETVATGLEIPWNMSWLPNGDMLITERPGRLRVLRDGELLAAEVSGLPDIFAGGQGGLFEVVPHPDFETNNTVYLTYSASIKSKSTLELAKAVYTPTETGGALSELEVLFTAEAARRPAIHYGGRIVWLEDGTLLLTSGEGSHQAEAQKLDNHFGKILKLNDDGSPAAGNPFAQQSGALPEIWSYGHRNPQGIALGSDGTVYANEHGPRGGDEMNQVEAGNNYGWPVATYGIDYSGAVISPLKELAGTTQPIFHWTPSIAPSSLIYYQGDDFPAWNGKLLTSALAYMRLQIADPANPGAPQQSLLAERQTRIRDVAQSPDGTLFVATETFDDSPSGEILRILPR